MSYSQAPNTNIYYKYQQQLGQQLGYEQPYANALGQQVGGLYSGLANNPTLDASTRRAIVGGAGEQYDAAADEAQRRALTTGNRQGLYAFLGQNARERASGMSQAEAQAQQEIEKRKFTAGAGLGALYGQNLQSLMAMLTLQKKAPAGSGASASYNGPYPQSTPSQTTTTNTSSTAGSYGGG